MSDMFSADLPGLRRLAGFAGDRAIDVRAIGKDLQGLPQASDDAFGDAGALDAYRAFFGAWTDELSINANSLDEIGQKLTDCANTYQDHDVHWSHKFQSIWPYPG